MTDDAPLGGRLGLDPKRTSVLRRVPSWPDPRVRASSGIEGDVCAFELVRDGSPIVVEAVSGRDMILAPGDAFLATPGHRESTRWVVGGIPDGGLVPGRPYWVLAQSGIVGDLMGDSPLEKSHLGRATYLGVVVDADGEGLNIGRFAAPPAEGPDRGAAVYLVVGTSAEVGKTTAGTTILRALGKAGADIVALKATGTSTLGEISTYRDFGASQAFDCVDFGLPTTYPSDRGGIAEVFDRMLDHCLSVPASTVLIECGGDMLGANVPVFIERLRRRRAEPKVVLAAADAVGALGGKQVLQDMGLSVSLVTGPCTDTPTLQRRTQNLCGIPAVNMTRGGAEGLF